MAFGNGAPRGWPGASVESITDGIPYCDLYFPATSMDPGAIKPTTYQSLQVNAQEQAYSVHEFPGGANTECFFTWAFRGKHIDLSAPNFRLVPYFIQIAESEAPDPAEYALIEYTIGVSYDGSTIDYSLEGAPEVALQSLIDAQYITFCASTTGDKAVSIPTLDGDGSLLSTNFNFLQFQVERFGSSGSDTFSESIYLLGCGLQYKTDFANIAQYPV